MPSGAGRGPAPLFTSYHGVDGTLSVYDDRAELAMRRPAEPRPGWDPLDLGGRGAQLAALPDAG
jgi:hypothetical protein